MNRLPARHRLVCLYWIGLLLVGKSGFSQTETFSELITHFSVNNGLPENRIRHVLEDHEGNLIVVTVSKGLFGYDGTRFFPLAINSQLPNLFIQQVIKDHQGRLWIACNYAGIWIYDHGKLYPFEQNHLFEKQHFVTLFVDQQQNVWIDVNRIGLFRWNGEGIENLTTHSNLFLEDIRQIQQKDEHAFFLLYANSDLYLFDLKTRRQTCILNRENANLHSFLCTREGKFWFSIHGEAIYEYDGVRTKQILKLLPEANSGAVQFYEDANGVIWFAVLDDIYSWQRNQLQVYPAVKNSDSVAFEDRFQNLWFATKHGLLKFIKPRLVVHGIPPPNPAGTQFKSMTLKNDFVFRDHRGMIWFADKNQQLFRFDGRQIQPFPWPDSLRNRTTAMTQGKDHRFWFYSQDKGLIAWDGNTFDTTLNAKLPANGCISTLFVDSQNRLWLGYLSRLIKYIYPRYGHPRFFEAEFWESRNKISSMRFGNASQIWLGTKFSNLLTISNQAESQTSFLKNANIQLQEIQNLCEHQNHLWGTARDGIFQYDLQTHKFQAFHASWIPEEVCRAPLADQFPWYTGDFYQQNSFYSLEKYAHFKHDPRISIYNIASLIDAPDGGAWIGSFSVGLYYANPDTIFRMGRAQGLPSLRISSLLLDSAQQLWIGTLDHGLFRLEDGRAIQTEVMKNAGQKISTLFEDRDGTLWVGTLDRGLVHLERHQAANFQKNLPDPAIWGIGQGHSNNIYVLLANADFAELKSDQFQLIPKNQIFHPDLLSAFQGKNFNFRENFQEPEANLSAGIFCWDGKSLQNFTVEDGLPGHEIFDITETADGKIWISTYNTGLATFSGEQFQPFINPKLAKLGRFCYLTAGPDSALWVLTNGDGLARVQGDSCQVWSSQSQLISVQVRNMQIDQKNRLILSAGPELYFFDAGNLQKIPGVYWPGVNHYNIDHFEVDPEKRIWFTGVSSHLFSYQSTDLAPVIKIKSGQIGNRQFEEIASYQPIEGNYHETVCALEFFGYHSSFPAAQIECSWRIRKKNQFSEWSPFSNRNRLIYTQLAPGQTTEFEIRAKSPNGLISTLPAKIQFCLEATPWYLKTWFWWLTSLIVLAIIFTAIYRESGRRMRFRNEFERHKMESDKLRELDQLKSSFFANISHEFRTPLTLILGPIEDFLAKRDFAKHREILQTMQRNAQRLQRLINQLLDLSKLETGSAQLNLKKINITHFVKALVSSFSSWAESKEIKLAIKLPKQVVIGTLDPDKFEKILMNLVSNALKFTTPGGKIVVQAGILNETSSGKKEILELKVSDNGIGISKELHEKIFNRFYQVDSTMKRGHEGTGIGLALTKELVELHGGNIFLESEVGKGTTFTVQIPLTTNGKFPNEVSDFSLPKIDFYENLSEDRETETPTTGNKNGKIILVVDDNADVRNYIGECLQDEFKILYAADGEQALRIASTQIPDLIISDVMMPKMDGFEFCRQIKINIETSHIPVILLTAKAANESKITGLETGADDYLIKPFGKSELKVRTRNLIDQRARLRKYFSRETLLDPGKIKLNSMDEEFLNHAIETIKSNLADEDFSVDEFSKKIGLSRQQLTRKLKAVTGFSTQDFIRKIRLDCAAILLKERTATVTEIAYSVGFDNSAYFAKCFKEQFGCSPSEYAKMGEV